MSNGIIPPKRMREYECKSIRAATPMERTEGQTYKRFQVDDRAPVYIAILEGDARNVSEPFPDGIALLVTEHPKIGDRFRMTLEKVS